MREIANWKVYGINVIPSDSCYQTIERLIRSGDLEQHKLQMATGWMTPIIIDENRKTISFECF